MSLPLCQTTINTVITSLINGYFPHEYGPTYVFCTILKLFKHHLVSRTHRGSLRSYWVREDHSRVWANMGLRHSPGGRVSGQWMLAVKPIWSWKPFSSRKSNEVAQFAHLPGIWTLMPWRRLKIHTGWHLTNGHKQLWVYKNVRWGKCPTLTLIGRALWYHTTGKERPNRSMIAGHKSRLYTRIVVSAYM